MSPATSLYNQDVSAPQALFAFGLIAAAIGISRLLRLDLEKDFWIASLRTTVQLIAVGFVLRWILGSESIWMSLTALLVMTFAAAQAVTSRLKKKTVRHFVSSLLSIIAGVWPLGFLSLWILFPGSASMQSIFFIPFMGVLLGNALSAISLSFLGLERIRTECLHEVETFKALGANSLEACQRLYRELLRQSLTPILNGMTIVGIVSLPGVMAGQLLGGVDPLAAARVQVLIMFLVLTTSLVGSLSALLLYHFSFMPKWLTQRSTLLSFHTSHDAPLALAGPSGSGKSRLLKSMTGLDDASIRTDLLLDSPLSPIETRSIFYVHQRPHFTPGTVEENLKWPYQFRANSEKAYDAALIAGFLKELELGPDVLSRPATSLSGGEAQLIHLIRVLQLRPELLFLDEPTASLDSQRTSLVERLLKTWLAENKKRRLVVVSHSVEQIQRFCGHVLHLKNGKLIYA